MVLHVLRSGAHRKGPPPLHPMLLVRPWHCARSGVEAVREFVPADAGAIRVADALRGAHQWERDIRAQMEALVRNGEDDRTMEEVSRMPLGCDIWFDRCDLPGESGGLEPDQKAVFPFDLGPHGMEAAFLRRAFHLIAASAARTNLPPDGPPNRGVEALPPVGNRP